MTLSAQGEVTGQYILDHFDEAMEKRHIEAWCQPVIRTVSGQICGLEALARWEDPVYGLLTPDKFIGVLERHRRIHELDGYIIRRVCEGLREMLDGEVCVPVSVNLSRLDYELCDIFEVVEAAVSAFKVPRSYICIELTESLLNSNEALMRNYMDRFQKAGYSVWMDDFGSGYSSLNVLKDYRFDELKIDMVFLSDFTPRSKSILASIVHMAKQIGIQTLCEGVDTEEKYTFLRNVGCEKAQGHLFGAAMPFRSCIRHATERGLSWEPPRLRKYYDDLGRLNLLSATPFLTDPERQDPGTGRAMNSIPLSVAEMRDGELTFLFINAAFEEIISGSDWHQALGVQSGTAREGLRVSVSGFAPPLRRMLEEAENTGEGQLHFVRRNEYYKLQARRIARIGKRCTVVASLTNLSKGAEISQQNELDDGLRQVYSLYEQVSVLNLNDCTMEAIYLSSHKSEIKKKNAEDAAQYYAECWVFSDDKERFLSFIDPKTLGERVNSRGGGYLSDYFRVRTYRGIYAWKCCTILPVREKIYFILLRDIEDGVQNMNAYFREWFEDPREREGLPLQVLWENIKRASPIKFFWKDAQRRFLGASKSFLDFYGFRSEEDILGKTDEEMGWHIHPDDYRESEESVIQEGAVSRNRPGTCIARGESRSIVASKMPLYSHTGDIVGLIGYFVEAGRENSETQAGADQNRTDNLTGLLNSRGLDEDLLAYRDEYELRGRDFARIEVSVEELSEINRRYGYDFGDSLLRAVGRSLLRCCGTVTTLGRESGSLFVAFHQFENKEELGELIARIRSIAKETHMVDGLPFTTYLAVGYALYSECENLVEIGLRAQLRRMTDDVENIPYGRLREGMNHVFYLYEDLPVAFAVYKLIERDGEDDAIMLYANRKCTELIGRSIEGVVGKLLYTADPLTPSNWMEMAVRASQGEVVTETFETGPAGMPVTVTASRFIGPGYCSFTYQPILRAAE